MSASTSPSQVVKRRGNGTVGMSLPTLGRDRVQIGGSGLVGEVATGAGRQRAEPLEQLMHTLGNVYVDHRIESVEPLASLFGLEVDHRGFRQTGHAGESNQKRRV